MPERVDPSSTFASINKSMTFTTGLEPGFTRTPANVKSDYIQTAANSSSATTSATKKRKSTTNDTSNVATDSQNPVLNNRSFTASAVPAAKKRKAGTKEATARLIPNSFDDCTQADKTLITMRDAGSNWQEIRPVWLKLTGEKTGMSTLPNRYVRLKANFTVIKEEDNPRLLEAKREVEESFEAQKWDLVARVVGEKGGDAYAGVVLKRQYKKLMVQGGIIPPEEVRDGDFEDPASDEDY